LGLIRKFYSTWTLPPNQIQLKEDKESGKLPIVLYNEHMFNRADINIDTETKKNQKQAISEVLNSYPNYF
jgi:hypothetical protein